VSILLLVVEVDVELAVLLWCVLVKLYSVHTGDVLWIRSRTRSTVGLWTADDQHTSVYPVTWPHRVSLHHIPFVFCLSANHCSAYFLVNPVTSAVVIWVQL